jgi:hypothetical protein
VHGGLRNVCCQAAYEEECPNTSESRAAAAGHQRTGRRIPRLDSLANTSNLKQVAPPGQNSGFARETCARGFSCAARMASGGCMLSRVTRPRTGRDCQWEPARLNVQVSSCDSGPGRRHAAIIQAGRMTAPRRPEPASFQRTLRRAANTRPSLLVTVAVHGHGPHSVTPHPPPSPAAKCMSRVTRSVHWPVTGKLPVRVSRLPGPRIRATGLGLGDWPGCHGPRRCCRARPAVLRRDPTPGLVGGCRGQPLRMMLNDRVSGRESGRGALLRLFLARILGRWSNHT